MLSLRASEIAHITAGEAHGEDVLVNGLSTDSRTLRPGMLFCAISGENFDGNAFLDAAAAAGAAAALATRAARDIASIVVDDTLRALHTLVADWRGRFEVQCVGITGSNGKTTVKEMVTRILEQGTSVLSTEGNLNNHIGVPLTLARLDAGHSRMVIEMGANHAGEIARLARLARPEVGVITVVAPAHLEGFGTVEGVARAKGEMIEALPSNGTAVVNGDGDFQSLWRELAAGRRLMRFGLGVDVDVRAEHRSVDEGSAIRLHTPHGVEEFLLPLHGSHNACNAAAAAAAALAIGVELPAIAHGLSRMQPVRGRLMPLAGARGVRILDDSYNANPESLKAALEVLLDSEPPRWLVLGDMAELGDDAARAHRDAGEMARDAGVQRLWCTGRMCKEAARGFGPGARHFEHATQLIQDLLGALDAPATVLVKGSRSAGMERVVAALTQATTEGQPACC